MKSGVTTATGKGKEATEAAADTRAHCVVGAEQLIFTDPNDIGKPRQIGYSQMPDGSLEVHSHLDEFWEPALAAASIASLKISGHLKGSQIANTNERRT